MIGANRAIDKDWSEFESYATNLYAKLLLADQSLSASDPRSMNMRAELPSMLDRTHSSSQVTSNVHSLQMKTVMDEITTLKRNVLDIRTYSEEVSS